MFTDVHLQEYHARMKFLSEVPLMKRLPKDEHPIVAEACEALASHSEQLKVCFQLSSLEN